MDDSMTLDACTLPTAERPLRLAEFDALFAEAVHAVELDRDILRMTLRGPVGLGARVRDLADRETACCSFFTFVIDGTDADLSLQIRVPSERRDILAALAARASEMAS